MTTKSNFPFFTYEIQVCSLAGNIQNSQTFITELMAQNAFDEITSDKLECGSLKIKHPYTEDYHSGVTGFIKLIAIKNYDAVNKEYFTRRKLNIKA